MGKILFALAVVAALGFGSLCITGSAAATPLRSPDALPVAAARADLADQVVMVCRTKRVCGPNGPLPHGAVLRATALPLGGPGFGHRYWRRWGWAVLIRGSRQATRPAAKRPSPTMVRSHSFRSPAL